MPTEQEWLEPGLESGVSRVWLIAGTNAHERPSSREILSSVGFIVTGVRLTSYESLYYSEGPHAGKLWASAEYQELAAVRGLMDAHVWHPHELLSYAEHHGVEAHFPTWIYVPPRQMFWWQTRKRGGERPELSLTLEFSWQRAAPSECDVLVGRSKHADAVRALEQRLEVPRRSANEV